MKPILLERLIRDEQSVTISPSESYIRSYREFIRYFERLEVIDSHHFMIGTSFAYSWMPTILTMHPGDIHAIAKILTAVKAGPVCAKDVCCVEEMVNNSFVGASKLLHFVNPNAYAIWDSRVCLYLFGTPSRVSDYQYFDQYQTDCRELVSKPSFAPVQKSISDKTGYAVSGLRAAEIIMYTCADTRRITPELPDAQVF